MIVVTEWKTIRYIPLRRIICKISSRERSVKSLLYIGINPSTAEPNKLAKTLKTVKRFSHNLDYDLWLMLNVYLRRAMKPDGLHVDLNIEYHQEKLRQIESILKNGNYNILAAWGGSISKRYYLKDSCIELSKRTKRYSVQWLNYGRQTKKGHPPHPSRLSYSWSFEKFHIEEYCSNIGFGKKLIYEIMAGRKYKCIQL